MISLNYPAGRQLTPKPPTTQDNTMNITLTPHEFDVLKTLVEYAATNTGNGADADPTTAILLDHVYADQPESTANLAEFVAKARKTLS